MFRHTIPIGRIAGIGIDLDYSWFLIFGLLTWVLGFRLLPCRVQKLGRVSEMAPGSVAHLLIFHMGQTRMVDVTLGEFPENAQAGQPQQGGPASAAALKGVQVPNLTPDSRSQLSLPASASGVVVTNVDPASPAAGSLQMGDVIEEVNRKPVHNVNEFQQALDGSGNQAVLLLVNRQGTTQFVLIQPQG